MKNEKILWENVPTLHLIPCKMPGLTCCPFRCVRPNNADDAEAGKENVHRRRVWCSRWKANRARDGFHYGCDEDWKAVDGRE